MMPCSLCPRNCLTDRSIQNGFCGCSSVPKVARIGLHRFEEPPISGSRGSGTVFFSGCNLKCVFCQNHCLQSGNMGEPFDAVRLANAYLELQRLGAHNINLVTPTPHIPVIAESIVLARDIGVALPFVFNTNSYVSQAALLQLDGLIDIYLPDLKYKSSVLSQRYSKAADYFEVAIAAIEEMYRQVGNLRLDKNGLATKGVLIRHLVLPACTFDTKELLGEICMRFKSSAYLSLMRQYTPLPSVAEPPLNRKITDREYQTCIDRCALLGLTNVFLQDKSSASFEYTPEFYNRITVIE